MSDERPKALRVTRTGTYGAGRAPKALRVTRTGTYGAGRALKALRVTRTGTYGASRAPKRGCTILHLILHSIHNTATNRHNTAADLSDILLIVIFICIFIF